MTTRTFAEPSRSEATATERAARGEPTLHERVTIFSAAAVAIAVAVTGIAGFLTTRYLMYENLDADLTRNALAISAQVNEKGASSLDPETLAGVGIHVMLVDGRGVTLSYPPTSLQFPVGDDEVALARRQTGRTARTVLVTDPARQELHAYRLVGVPGDDDPATGPGSAVVVARQLTRTQDLLSAQFILFMIIGSLGALLSSLVGSTIARSSLVPLRRLSRAVTRVTRTDELQPIEVRGNDELARLTRSFNTMLESLSSSRNRQRQLIADAGHELRTPLTSLRTNIELLLADEKASFLPEEARTEILGDVNAQLTEFTSLIQDLVQLAREDRPVASRETVDLADVVDAALRRVKLRAPAGVTWDCDVHPWFVLGEPDALERAITNLLDNAVKFGPAHQTITVRLDETGILTVSDEGPGIAEKDLDHVFDRFYRAEATRSTPGTGLGLSIVAQTVARHDGWVRAGRAASGGAEFTVFLPRLGDERPEPLDES